MDQTAIQLKISLVIPAYNEERRLPASLQKIREYFKDRDVEVLVVVEKSQDRTVALSLAAVAGDRRFRIIDNQVHRGKGYAVRTGMLQALGELVFFMDADLSTPLEEVGHFLQHFSKHPKTQVVIGSREHARSEIVVAQHPLRRGMGRTFNKFVRIFAGGDISDTQCGFKAFRAAASREIFSRQTLDGFAFDVEVLMLARELGYAVEVLPVKWLNHPDSKVRVIRDSLRMLRDLIVTRYRVRRSMREKPATPAT